MHRERIRTSIYKIAHNSDPDVFAHPHPRRLPTPTGPVRVAIAPVTRTVATTVPPTAAAPLAPPLLIAASLAPPLTAAAPLAAPLAVPFSVPPSVPLSVLFSLAVLFLPLMHRRVNLPLPLPPLPPLPLPLSLLALRRSRLRSYLSRRLLVREILVAPLELRAPDGTDLLEIEVCTQIEG